MPHVYVRSPHKSDVSSLLDLIKESNLDVYHDQGSTDTMFPISNTASHTARHRFFVFTGTGTDLEVMCDLVMFSPSDESNIIVITDDVNIDAETKIKAMFPEHITVNTPRQELTPDAYAVIWNLLNPTALEEEPEDEPSPVEDLNSPPRAQWVRDKHHDMWHRTASGWRLYMWEGTDTWKPSAEIHRILPNMFAPYAEADPPQVSGCRDE